MIFVAKLADSFLLRFEEEHLQPELIMGDEIVCFILYMNVECAVNLQQIFTVSSLPESEPRDAGTDQRSSGIIRLHTIKQIIDRVSLLLSLYF